MSDQSKQKIISEYNKNPGYKSFLSWPGGGPENLNSSVWTFDAGNQYFPLITQSKGWRIYPLNTIFLYSLIWIFLLIILYIFVNRAPNVGPSRTSSGITSSDVHILASKWPVFLFAYIIGLIILILHEIIPEINSYLSIVNNPKPTLEIINSPGVANFNPKLPITDENYINTEQMSEYKVLIKNDLLPKSNQFGYLVTARTFLEAQKDNKVEAVNFGKYLNKDCSGCLGYDAQEDEQSVTYENRFEGLAALGFYLGTLVLTFGLYIHDIHTKGDKLGRRYSFLTICICLLFILISKIISNILPKNNTLISFDQIIDNKSFVIIIAISFAIVSILIV
jgi:hypothetical protein